MRRALPVALVLVLTASAMGGPEPSDARREYNGPYAGPYLERVAFPLGGIGAGMVCLEGTGALSHVSVRNRLQAFHEPCMFAAIRVPGEDGGTARVLEGPVPRFKVYGSPRCANGAPGQSYGLPRFASASFLARFPFGTVTLADPAVPLTVEVTGWSPFVPGHADDSSLPVAALEYRFANATGDAVDAVFSFHARNFMAVGRRGSSIGPLPGGFVLRQAETPEHPDHQGAFAVFVDDERVVVDHAWFRGGWWDALTLAWRNVTAGRTVANPPAKGAAPGASLYVPISVPPGGKTTVRLQLAWYVPRTGLRYGGDAPVVGPAFARPSRGAAPDQQPVTGFLGQGLVNSFDPAGDGLVGTLTSPPFRLSARYVQFLIGGGRHPGRTCVELIVDGKTVRTATGADSEALAWTAWDVTDLAGRTATIRIVDRERGAWGHVNVDEIVLADRRFESAADYVAKRKAPGAKVRVLADFEATDWAGWTAEGPTPVPPPATSRHVPWYAVRFAGVEEVAADWRARVADLRRRTAVFRDAFYDTTLPPEVVEAVAANLTILKSPTVLRQSDGRLWCFEGCSDDQGCCHGSCTHVWNYAQAIPHLFPDLERSLRETEFQECQDERGHQTFRAPLPIRPAGHGFHAAADGQLGGIMKVHREWRLSGDTTWLRAMWPAVKRSLAYCRRTWDPRGRGVLEEPHHNTYDIEYWGPDGHCSSIYLGALAAAIEMGTALGDDVAEWRSLLAKGRKVLETELWNGEYFFQKVTTEGLDATFRPLPPEAGGPGYEDVIRTLNEQGPKYQYGTGCLSDGVLGFWLARMCGLDRDIVDAAKIRTNLASIHRYNLKRDLSTHANPQRPAFALGKDGGLLLCTWPRGDALAIPFVYSDEVWTGIEYQVASHLMLVGLVEEGLEIVRTCRDRYDGRVRNPFDEYECGHWYARALSSYGLLQGLTGVRYDAVEKTLFIDSRVGESFRSFLSTATGFGVVGLRDGRPFVDVRSGEIEVDRLVVSGKETR